MGKNCVLDIKLNSKEIPPKSDTIIRVSPEMYQILKDFSRETNMTIKDFAETLMKFALEHVKVTYV